MAWNTDVSADGKPHSVLTPKNVGQLNTRHIGLIPIFNWSQTF